MNVKNLNFNFIRVSFPKWVKYFMGIGFGLSILFLSIIYYDGYGPGFPTWPFLIIFWPTLILGIWFYTFLFSETITSQAGLEHKNPFGFNRRLSWEEIVEVKRPLFGVPVDLTYIVSNKNEKILLIRSKKNYLELIEEIKTKAPNLISCKY